MENNYRSIIEREAAIVFDSMRRRVAAADMARIESAFRLADEAHREQRRKSGEPYIVHPIAVAKIVAQELELGANPVIAAFLHDVVEDTSYTIGDIRERFGDDVAFLVGVVTKPKKARYEHSKQVDNFRQILASVSFDIRAMLIKLADRLHNMRTLESMRPDKQMKIAGETDYFYAPLANRLGLYHIKTELENLSFQYRCPREYAALEALMADEMAASSGSLREFMARMDSLFAAAGIAARSELRYRKPYSVWRKMQSKCCDFHHVDGKHYIRVIYHVDDDRLEKKTSLDIYSVLTDHFREKPGSVSNYIDTPKENGYQSFHVKLLGDNGKWEEIHISSERMMRNSRLGCAAERTEENVRAWLRKFSTVLKEVAENDKEMDFMEGVTSSFYNDDIMVFTPKGKGVILPKGASALDFAYEIHTEVGKKAAYARINGKLRSVKTTLHRGDSVEIGTDDNILPDYDWLNHVSTYKAKHHLRTYFANRPAIGYQRCTKCHPLPGDEVIGFKTEGGSTMLHKRNCEVAIRLAAQQGDSIVAVNFDENDIFLYPVRIRILGVDRYHLLSDLIECITERLKLSITRLHTETVDNIAECSIDFAVHSADELETAIESIGQIEGVDEVERIDIE